MAKISKGISAEKKKKKKSRGIISINNNSKMIERYDGWRRAHHMAWWHGGIKNRGKMTRRDDKRGFAAGAAGAEPEWDVDRGQRRFKRCQNARTCLSMECGIATRGASDVTRDGALKTVRASGR